jgi:hypothetical protein
MVCTVRSTMDVCSGTASPSTFRCAPEDMAFAEALDFRRLQLRVPLRSTIAWRKGPANSLRSRRFADRSGVERSDPIATVPLLQLFCK